MALRDLGPLAGRHPLLPTLPVATHPWKSHNVLSSKTALRQSHRLRAEGPQPVTADCSQLLPLHFRGAVTGVAWRRGWGLGEQSARIVSVALKLA